MATTLPRSPVDTAKALYAAFGRGDIPAALEIFHPDVEWRFFAPPEIPYAGPRRGRAGMAEFFRILGSSVDVLAFSVDEILPAGDHVVATGHEKDRVKATGKVAEVDWVHLITVRDGKIARMREWYDTATMAKAYAR